ncbi:ATP-grasp domain-containing protein [Citreimonas salinaria]|uniref:ATP-grasp domain-containing protein n=1 Tax=Citreimonas salinaria TaxID=321339 RepID=A0A1H3LL33_9RHOB|nr:ATP-grasp domain-containing protein [Citreimonas salinaria]SDY64849.1 ATP-grasp domain-containing protein [Citreimonas salinaria]
MKKNIYVLGMLDWQLEELKTIRDADLCRFHSLLTTDELMDHEAGFDELLRRARRQLNEGDKPDAIVCHWDFPSSCLAPILAAEYGLPGPSLEAVLRCEHKYWARIEQARVAPECVPDFEAVDPFDPEAADKMKLDFPIWLKPVKGFSSQLGFKITDREGLDKALEEMREGIGDLGHIFDECLDHAELPPEVQGIGGSHAIAESIMSGDQFAHEGYVRNHKVTIHGVLDMMLSSDGKAVAGLRYPADLPDDLVDRANDVGRKIMRQVGFNDGCFNVEFLYDEDTDKLWVIEANTRISQSHCEMFRMVDGRSNHEIAVSVALGDEPTLPDHKGDFDTSAKFYITKDDDAKVTREPTKDELREISDEFGALVEFEAHEGDTLSDLPNQPVYCYNVGYAWLGADSPQALRERYRELVSRLPMEFSDGNRLSTEM